MSIEHSKTVRFTLNADGGDLVWLDEEMSEAATYMVKPSPETGTIAVGRNKRITIPIGSVSSETSIGTPGLHHRLGVKRSKLELVNSTRYEKVGVLGEGGAGIVYEMRDNNMARTVAVKILKNTSKEEKENFLLEGQIAAQLEHPNIIPVYDLEADESGQVYLTMKDVKGDSLKSYIDGQLELSLERIIMVFLKVCDALTYAHNSDMIHQDVKPENIMVGEFGEVFLIDWGAASLAGNDMQLSPVYMSPQQAQGLEAEPRDDVYCLGASLFHTLFKRFPTDADTVQKLWDKKVEGIIDPLTPREKRSVPKALTAVALKAMHADPELRYQSVAEFADDLIAYQAGYATTAEEPSILTQLGLLIRRRFREAAAIAVGATLLTIGGLIVYVKLNESRMTAKDAVVKQVQAELEAKEQQERARQLKQQRMDSWVPMLTQDFSSPELDPRLKIMGGDVRNGSLSLGYQSSMRTLDIWDGPMDEPKLSVTFSCDVMPYLEILTTANEGAYSRGLLTDQFVSVASYQPEYQTLANGSTPWSDVLHYDRPNELECWLRDGVWSLQVNGQLMLQYYDSDAAISHKRMTISFRTYRITGTLQIHAVTLSERRAPEYVSILEPGRALRRVGNHERAREWFLSRRTDNHELNAEAQLLAAITDAGQGAATQLSELDAIAKTPGHPFRNRALQEKAQVLIAEGDWRQAFDIAVDSIDAEHSGQFFDVLWTKLRQPIRSLPVTEKRRVLRTVAKLPVGALDIVGLELDNLDFFEGKISDSLRSLIISSNAIEDISPLAGSNLRSLTIRSTKVADLSPLRDVPLAELAIDYTPVKDLSPLAGKSLDVLLAKGCKKLDTSGLRNMKVRQLILDGTPVDNPDDVVETDARVLRMNRCGLNSLAFLRNMKPIIFKASKNNLTALEGLEGQDLDELILEKNAITDLVPLTQCKVRNRLRLNSNPIKNVSPLQGNNTVSLELDETLVTDLSILRTMKNLKNLSMNDRYQSRSMPPRLETLGNLFLDELRLDNLGITDISPLSRCRIDGTLSLSNNPIIDVSPLANQPLKKLILRQTLVSDWSALEKLPNLEELLVTYRSNGGAPTLDLGPLRNQKLRRLTLGNYRIRDFSPLVDCSNLGNLELHDIPLDNLSRVHGIPCRFLNLQRCNISSLKGIRSIKLERLIISEKAGGKPPVLDISALAGLSIEDGLIFDNVNVRDLTPLKHCTIGTRLSLTNSSVSDISPLAGQPLRILDISNTKVTDLSVLPTLKNLEMLILGDLKFDEKNRKILESLPAQLYSSGRSGYQINK